MSDLEDEISALAARVRDLQRGFTSNRDERAIAAIFLATVGNALTALKNALDSSNEYHTLHELLYHDIDDAEIRRSIIAHFKQHAEPCAELKILSDIDDTFYCNWIDARYPKKTVYPGVRTLYRELDIGNHEAGRHGDLAFLTARPYDRLGRVDSLTHKLLREHGVTQSLILAGSITHLFTNQLIAEAKHQRFLEFQPLYPEYSYVFLGDSGQGDVTAGQLMRAHPDVRAVFIHDVVHTPQAQRQAHREEGIYFHDTYVEAAIHAFDLGLVSQSGLRRVAQDALNEFSAVTFANSEQREALRNLFRRDLAACNDRLDPSSRLATSSLDS